MPDVMQQDGDLCGFHFFVRDFNFFGAQNFECLVHEVHCAKSMMKPGMNGSRVNQFGKAKLTDMAHALEERMLQQVEYQLTFDGNEPINRIVYNLILVHCVT